MNRNKYLKSSVLVAALGLLSLALFPGQALLSNGVCIRFIDIPFTHTMFIVPSYTPLVWLTVFAGLVCATFLLLLLAWRSPA